jgi:hypothetical protein
MTENTIDKLMKPYWDEQFKDSYLTEWNEIAYKWYGIVIKKPNGGEYGIVGYPIKDKVESLWFYSNERFRGHSKLFNLTIKEFNSAMVRYINKKYNLNVKEIC